MTYARPALVLGIALLSLGRSVFSAEIPAHPRILRFPPSAFEVPMSDPRRIEPAPDTVAFVERDSLLPLIELTFAFRVGSHDDPRDRTGLAVLTGAMLTRGGSEALAPADLDAALETAGADLHSFVRGQRTAVRLSVPTWAAPQAIEILFDLVTAPRFDGEVLDVVRRSALERLDRRNEDPLDVLEREWTWLVLGRAHPAGRAPTTASLAAISRADMASFYRCFFRPEEMVAAISGDFSADLLGRIQKRFAAWGRLSSDRSECGSSGTGSTPADRASPARLRVGATSVAGRPPPPAGARVVLAPHPTPQAKLMIGHRLERPPAWNDPERFALLVAGEILGGGGAISRLNGRLRTSEGLVYRASADLELDAAGQEDFRIFLETRPERVWRAIELVEQEVARLRDELVHPREFEIVRQTLIGNLRSDFDTAEEIAGYLAENELLGRPPDYWRRYAQALERVGREEIRSAARKYLRPKDFIVLVVGPEGELLDQPEAGRIGSAGDRRIEILPRRHPGTLEPLDSKPGTDS